MKKNIAVFAARKDDPIKKGAVDGMAELMEGKENFVYPEYKGETIEPHIKMLEDSLESSD
jgi:hypothetical protein